MEVSDSAQEWTGCDVGETGIIYKQMCMYKCVGCLIKHVLYCLITRTMTS